MDEELEVLSAIYCSPGELHISPDGCGGKHVTLKMRSMAVPSQPEVMLVFVLASTYPFSSPDVSVFCSSLSYGIVKALRDELKAQVDAHKGMPVLMELIATTQQLLQSLPLQESATVMSQQNQTLELQPSKAVLSSHSVSSGSLLVPCSVSCTIPSLPSPVTCTTQSSSGLPQDHSPSAGYVSNNLLLALHQKSNPSPTSTFCPHSAPSARISENSINESVSHHSINPKSALCGEHVVKNGRYSKAKGSAGHPQLHSPEVDAAHSHHKSLILQPYSAFCPSSSAGSTSVMEETVVIKDPEPGENTTLLLYLDHMRSKSAYIKLIKRWVQELGLTGRLFFCDKLILILLQGFEPCIKSYLKKHRTENVDVDSKGRPCKEKMMTVLRETKEIQYRFADFEILECASRSELEKVFDINGMGDLYQQCVCIPSKSKSK